MAAYTYINQTTKGQTQFIGLFKAFDGALEMVNINAIVKITEGTDYSYKGVAKDEPPLSKYVIDVHFDDGKMTTYNGQIKDVAGALGIQLNDHKGFHHVT